jgi:hypothetical protein
MYFLLEIDSWQQLYAHSDTQTVPETLSSMGLDSDLTKEFLPRLDRTIASSRFVRTMDQMLRGLYAEAQHKFLTSRLLIQMAQVL